MTAEVLLQKITFREFRTMEFEDTDLFNYELLEGEIGKKASPSIQHQRISGNLYFQIRLFLAQNPLGEAFAAPLDVVLEDHSAPQPDLFYVSFERDFVLDEKEGVVIGTPDLIVEIISPTSVQRDRYRKKELYLRFGVREYWLVDPSNRFIEVFKLAQDHYEIFSSADETGKVASAVLPGFEVAVGPLMAPGKGQ